MSILKRFTEYSLFSFGLPAGNKRVALTFSDQSRKGDLVSVTGFYDKLSRGFVFLRGQKDFVLAHGYSSPIKKRAT